MASQSFCAVQPCVHCPPGSMLHASRGAAQSAADLHAPPTWLATTPVEELVFDELEVTPLGSSPSGPSSSRLFPQAATATKPQAARNITVNIGWEVRMAIPRVLSKEIRPRSEHRSERRTVNR